MRKRMGERERGMMGERGRKRESYTLVAPLALAIAMANSPIGPHPTRGTVWSCISD